MRVPPPYVPQLGGSAPAAAGPAGFVPDASADIAKPLPDDTVPIITDQSEPSAQFNSQSKKLKMPSWMVLTIRERILAGLLLISLIMVPAVFPQASVDARKYVPSDPSLQSVERAEENFAGSAFYFIDPGYAIPQNYGDLPVDPLANNDFEAVAETADGINFDRNQTARAHLINPIAFRGSLTDNNRALQCLTSAIYYEAGMEPDAGQRAVAQVILNRVRHPSYPSTVCGVIFQGSERRTGCQFSYTCDGSMRRKPNKFHWNRSRGVAAAALAGKVNSTVGTATHYHATYVYPYWAPSLKFLGTIGAHRFYSWKGKAGRSSAFASAIAAENRSLHRKRANMLPRPPQPSIQSHWKKRMKPVCRKHSDKPQNPRRKRLRRQTMPGVTLYRPRSIPVLRKPIRLLAIARKQKRRAARKLLPVKKLPDVSQVKPAYRNAGTWKKKPGS